MKKPKALPHGFLFFDQYGNYVTKNSVMSSKSIEELWEIELELIRNGDTILDNVIEDEET